MQHCTMYVTTRLLWCSARVPETLRGARTERGARVQAGDARLGYETEAFAIYDSIRQLKCPVRTLCVGTAFGEAAMLLAAGARPPRCALRLWCMHALCDACCSIVWCNTRALSSASSDARGWPCRRAGHARVAAERNDDAAPADPAL
jgi:Clp protease